MAAFTVRLLGPSDAVAYRALRLQNLTDHPNAFTSSFAEESQKDGAEDAKRLLADADKPNDFFIGAFDGETLAGMVGLKGAYRQSERHAATVVGMMVERGYRNQGLGKTLVMALIARVRSMPELTQVVLTVTEGNMTAQNLYSQCGFVVYGLRPKAIRVGDQWYGKVHMLLDLMAA